MGKTYVITVSPDVPNGESGYGVATTIVGSQTEKAGIVGVQSVRKTGYQFQSGIYRDCYIGTNQFAVYTTAATAKLSVTVSHPALIDEILVEDTAAVVPGTMITSPSSVSLANAVKVEKGAGNAITYTLDATPGKKVNIEGEEISIQPEFAKDDNESPFEIQDGKFVFKVKSIPGLKYQVLASDSLDPDSFTPAGKEREATGTRRELTVTRSGETKWFFKVRVSR